MKRLSFRCSLMRSPAIRLISLMNSPMKAVKYSKLQLGNDKTVLLVRSGCLTMMRLSL